MDWLFFADGSVRALPFLLALMVFCGCLYLAIYTVGSLLGLRLLDWWDRRERTQ